MPRDLQQLADDHGPPRITDALDALDLHAQEGQPLGELLRGEVDVDELTKP